MRIFSGIIIILMIIVMTYYVKEWERLININVKERNLKRKYLLI